MEDVEDEDLGQWEIVAKPAAQGDYTERLRVPGGWLYRSWIGGKTAVLAMAFVPKPEPR